VRQRLVAFVALIGLFGTSAPIDTVQTWIQSGRRRAARTDEHAEVAAAPAEPTSDATHELKELGPFVEAASVRLAPPAAIAIEPDPPPPCPFVRFERPRPPARGPPLAG
jgi:hypothetical protein